MNPVHHDDLSLEPVALTIAKGAAILVVFNTVIALMLMLFGVGSFSVTLRFSQAIGLSIFALSWSICLSRGLRRNDWKTAAVAVPLGGLLGTAVGSYATGISPGTLFSANPDFVVASLASALVFGTAISYYFYSRSLLAETTAALQRQQARQDADRRHLVEAQLRLLQAQIEPHFLFNTLSNVLSLIESDPPTAARMLDSLTRYLRRSLQATRRDTVSLAEELALVEHYLAIQAQRMGERLDYAIEVPDALRDWQLPPFLLQPLVENAVTHGIEPEIAGGRVTVTARRAEGGLLIEVCDTGPGIQPDDAPGIGLANVRERLAARYGGAAELTLQAASPRGLRAVVRLPEAEPA